MSSLNHNSTPAERLVGQSLPNGWIVEETVPRIRNATGGNFSACYFVKSRRGQRAFLKAMDYEKALNSQDPASELQAMTAAYNFERNLLEQCRKKNLSRVVSVLDSGTLRPNNNNPYEVVEYLIFELAERDIRGYIEFNQNFDTAWTLRTLHNIATALQQLHINQIVHQDLKPSNVLVFDQRKISKIADLGRANSRQSTSPYDDANFAGDCTYAPPELLYGQISPNWEVRRLGCDMYQFGSMVVFFIEGFSMTHLLFSRLDNPYHYDHWSGEYSEVLPYIQHEFAQVIRDLVESTRTDYADEIANTVRQLCNPDPAKRGHPIALRFGVNQYSLERYVSIFNRLAKHAELSLTHQLPLKKH